MSKKILVVDDDMDFREAVKSLLEAKDYEVFTAENGKEGLEKAKTFLPDLILLDVMMATKTEGFDVSRELRQGEKTKDISVVILTGIRERMNLPFGFEPDKDWLPVSAVIEKPIKPEAFLKAVEENIKKT